MRTVMNSLIVIAVAIVPSVPAATAQQREQIARSQHWDGHGSDQVWVDDRRYDRRRRQHNDTDTVLLGPSPDWDGNRSFDPDRWNDWWHERPNRAYPRWVQQQTEERCDRMWWGGGVWRCSW